MVAFLRYGTAALSQPWEVGKTLLQVQWVPRSAGDIPPEPAVEVLDDEGEVRRALQLIGPGAIRLTQGTHSLRRS